MATPAPKTPPEPPRGLPVAWIAVAGVLLVIGGFAAFYFLNQKPEEVPTQSGRTRDSPPYLPTTHMDPARSSLTTDEKGQGVAEILLKDVPGDVRPAVKVRASTSARSFAVFILRAPDSSKVGVVEARFTPGAGPDEVVAHVPLGKPADHVTVYDQRWEPREGFEMGTPSAPK